MGEMATIHLLVTSTLGIDVDQAWHLLDPAERAAAEDLRFADDRVRAVRAHAVLRLRLGPAATVYGAGGKAGLAGGPPVSLSHRGDWVALAWSWEVPTVGVDIEPSAAEIDATTAAVVLHPQEIARAKFDGPAGLVRAWTRKEAYLKATGEGLTDAARTFAVSDRLGGTGPAPDLVVTTIELCGHAVSVAAPGRWELAIEENLPGG
jgi:4'-phosphopantetheinyl transferase